MGESNLEVPIDTWCAIGRLRSGPACHYFSMPWYLHNSIAKIPANLLQRLGIGFWEDSACDRTSPGKEDEALI
jgi:hypothetical protein